MRPAAPYSTATSVTPKSCATASSHVYDVTKVPAGDTAQNPHLVEGDVVYVPTGHHVNVGDIFGAITASRVLFF